MVSVYCTWRRAGIHTDHVPMDCVHMRAGVQTQTTFLWFILMIMNCAHLRRPQCELLFLEILRVTSSSSLIVLHGSQSVFLSIVCWVRSAAWRCAGWHRDIKRGHGWFSAFIVGVQGNSEWLWPEHSIIPTSWPQCLECLIFISFLLFAEASLILFYLLVILVPFF